MSVQQITENPGALFFLVTALSVFFIFRLLQYLTTRNNFLKSRQYIGRIFIFIEIIVWFAYLLGGIDLFFQSKPVISVICGLILLFTVFWIIWFVLRDFIAGLFLKMNSEFKIGEIIEFDGISGKIVRIGNRLIELENESAAILKIPFNQFYVKRYLHSGISQNSATCNYTFTLNSKLNSIEAVESIKTLINQLPWTNSKYNHKVTIEESKADETIVRINAYLFDKKYLDQFQQLIKQRFE